MQTDGGAVKDSDLHERRPAATIVERQPEESSKLVSKLGVCRANQWKEKPWDGRQHSSR
jgi:hypothetical protein